MAPSYIESCRGAIHTSSDLYTENTHTQHSVGTGIWLKSQLRIE